jgi:hypothetical protein
MTERPDPLAEPEGYGVRPGPQELDTPDLSVCSQHVTMREDPHCDQRVEWILWFGCLKGEHAGPLPYCEAHALHMANFRAVVCGVCEGPVRFMKFQRVLPDGRIVDAPPPQAGEVTQQALDRVFGDDDDGRLGG